MKTRRHQGIKAVRHEGTYRQLRQRGELQRLLFSITAWFLLTREENKYRVRCALDTYLIVALVSVIPPTSRRRVMTVTAVARCCPGGFAVSRLTRRCVNRFRHQSQHRCVRQPAKSSDIIDDALIGGDENALSHGTVRRDVSEASTVLDDRETRHETASSSSSSSSSSTSSSDGDVPTNAALDARLWGLALPAVAELLLDPTMGAVDTAFVGRLEGEHGAAALGGLAISTTVFNFAFKIFNFLAVVTGPLVGQQMAKAGGKTTLAGRNAAAETVGGAMALALILGVSATGVLLVGSESLLDASGASDAVQFENGASSELHDDAEVYLKIRAFAAPAALIDTVAVGAYRGTVAHHDTHTYIHTYIHTMQG